MNTPLNIPEKIIFVIDTVIEPNATEFQSNSGEHYNSLYMAKRVVEMFMHNKSSFSARHEFAIMTLDSKNAHWQCDFTKVVKDLVTSLESIKESIVKNEKFFDVQSVFKIVHQHVLQKSKILERNVVRIILLYSRSNIIPRFNIADSTMQELIQNPNVFLDILYIHESNCSQYKCEEVYAELSKLDIRNSSYIMEVSRNAMVLHNLMAKLLAHPKQRVPQKQFSCSLHPLILQAAEARRKASTD